MNHVRFGSTHRPRRQSAPDDDRGTIAILLMVILVGVSLSALLVPMIITANRTTRFDTTRVQALDAAQSGIDVTLGLIRSSVSSGIGTSAGLPCGPLSGPANSTSAAAYSTVIEYFTFDPATEPYPSTNAMKCSPGYGTYDTASSVVTPSFARITSTGTVGVAVNGSTGGRTLTTTYVFKTSNANIAGGVIQLMPTSTSLCMDVGSATAIANKAVLVQACSLTNPPLGQQVFTYRSDLTIQLQSSVTSTNANGLCLDTSARPAAAGGQIVLAQCAVLGSPSPYTQQWSYNDNGAYQAAQSSSKTDGVLPNLCMSVASQVAGQAVLLATCTGSQWVPAPSVGPGAAARPQWVNFSEFGRCLDVTDQSIRTTHLIDYPCKQNPNPAQVRWNQLFQAPVIPTGQTSVTGQIYTNDTADNIKACLTSPGVNGNYPTMGQPASGTLTSCGTGLASQTWTIYGGATSLPYSTKYTIVDYAGLCLGLTVPANSETWSAIDVEKCTGTTEQKWNADPNVLAASLKNTAEK